MRLLTFLLAVFLLPALNSANADESVDLVVGESQFFHADYIEIFSVKSSGDGFQIGSTITVKGLYTLNSIESANLCFFSTASLKPGEKATPTQIQASQRTKAHKGKHQFTLSKVIKSDGSPHLTFYHPKTGKPFGGVYFGDKTNVLMKKSWSYEAP